MDRERYELRKSWERHRAVQEAIAPVIKAAVRATSYMMPKIILYPDGHIERKYSAEDQAIIDQYHELIKQAVEHASRIYL